MKVKENFLHILPNKPLLKSKVSEKDSETFVSDFINKLDSEELKRGKKE